DARTTCRTAPSWWSGAGRPGARSATSCCEPGAGCSCPSPGTGALRGGSAARMSAGGWTGWAASPRRSTVFPRQWPPSTVVTGVSGGYDVNVRQMAADGIRVLGRVIGATDGTLAVATNANEVLDEADAAFAGFVADAREFAATNPDVELSEEEPAESAIQPAELAEVEYLDLRREKVAAIVWATGYDYDYGWLRAPVLDVRGRPLQQRGVTKVPGLYFLGLHWMHTFKSGLLAGVGSD